MFSYPDGPLQIPEFTLAKSGNLLATQVLLYGEVLFP